MLSLLQSDVNSHNSDVVKQLKLHMESNRCLRRLSVRGFIGTTGFKYIAQGIAASASLTSIILEVYEENRLGEEGAKPIAEGIA